MAKKLALPTEISYNNGNKIAVAEPYPRVKVVQNAKRTQKTSNCRRRKASHTLWRNLPNSLVLQKTQVEMVFTDLCKVLSTFRPLSSCRNGLSHYLRTDCWHSPLKQNENSPGQWFFSTDRWIKKLPILKQSKTLSEAHRIQDNSGYQQTTRFPEVENVLSSTSSHKPLIRFRLYSLHHLRKVHRRSQGRLQPFQERRPFLPSSCLLRIPQEGILARGFKTRKCLYFIWVSRIPGRVSGQNSSLCLSYPGASRLGIFRPQIHRTPRRQRDWLCHCSQDNQYHQGETRWTNLSQIQEELGSRRVSLYSLGLEEASPLHSDTPSLAGKEVSSTNPLHLQTIRLSSIRNQSFHEIRKCLVFLQGPSSYRNLYQRTQARLCTCQDSNKEVPGQSSIFLHASFRLQHRQLVPANLFTTKIPEYYSADHSHRTSGFTCKVGEVKEPECAQIASRIYHQTRNGSHYTEN